MKRVLLVAALVLMLVSLTSPLWVGSVMRAGRRHLGRTLVAGRVKGDFSDHPWAGTTVQLGSEKLRLGEDGEFSFAPFPGTHILRVCCSIRFQPIYQEIAVADRDLYLELDARPLRVISGRVVTPRDRPLSYALIVSATLIHTNVVDRTIVASDGSFEFHLLQGDWRLEIENLMPGHTLQSVTLDGTRIDGETFRVSNGLGPSLPLQITLQ